MSRKISKLRPYLRPLSLEGLKLVSMGVESGQFLGRKTKYVADSTIRTAYVAGIWIKAVLGKLGES